MDIKNISFPFLTKEILNTYTFRVFDENHNLIDEKVCHNITMPQRYFQKNVTNLRLKLGTMLDSDYAKYQSDGKWKKGWAVHYGSGGIEMSSNENFDVGKDGGNYYQWHGRVDVNDTSLWGTEVNNISLKWECANIEKNKVVLTAKSTWGYHSPTSYTNADQLVGYNKNVGAGERGNYLFTETSHQTSTPIKSSTEDKDYPMYIYGIHITDGGLVSGSDNTLLSHFAVEVSKRPTDYLEISAEITFNLIDFPLGQPFIGEGSALYAHGLNPNSGTAQLKPTRISLSSFPIVNCDNSKTGGIVPIRGNGPSFSLSMVETDKPNDWDSESQGEWFGFPQYGYYGSGEIYETTTENVKIGEDSQGNPIYQERKSYNLNDKEQKEFNWNDFEERELVRLEGSNFGPVRSVVIDNFAALDKTVVNNLIPGKIINFIRIGTGNGVMTRFYHPFTSETGRAVSGYYRHGTSSLVSCNTISASYNISDNPFSSTAGFVGVYDGNGKLICDGDSFNTLNSYDSKLKCCSFSKHPFCDTYLPYGSGIFCGDNCYLVYERPGLTLKSAWLGLVTGLGIDCTLTFITAPTIEDLFHGSNRRYTGVAPSMFQHPQTNLNNFESMGYIAIHCGRDWNDGYLYMGGLYYSAFDQAGVRISSVGDVGGYIEFNTPPPSGAFIYVNAQITVPFIHYFNTYNAKAAFSFGKEDDNGTEVTDLNDPSNWIGPQY